MTVLLLLRSAAAGGDTNVNAGHASATGVANQPAAKVNPNAGTGTATGTANQPAVKVNPNAGTGTASGVANQPTITASSNVPAGSAAATGVANDATVSTSSATNAPAGHATASGVADNPAAKVAPNAGTGTATGAATVALPWPYNEPFTYSNQDLDDANPHRWETITGSVDGWGPTNGPLVVTSNTAQVGGSNEMNLMLSPSTGSYPFDDQYAQVDYDPNGATLLWGAGIGVRATGNTGPTIEGYQLWAYLFGALTLRLDRCDDGVATPLDQAVLPDANPHTIKITVVGNEIKGYLDDVEMVSATDSTYQTERGYFLGAYTGNNVVILDNFEAGQQVGASSPSAGHAAATGTADTTSTKVAPNAGTAAATGTAYDATVSTSAATNAPAELASATGIANQPSTNVAPNAGHAAATGVGNDATVQTSAAGSANAGHATATGEANQPTVKVNPNAGTASATGTANNATTTSDQDRDVFAGHAAATGEAFQPSIKVTFNAGHATASGVAERPLAAIMPAAGTATAASTAGATAVAIYVSAAIALATGTGYDADGPDTPDVIILDYIVRRARPGLVGFNRPGLVRRQRPS